MIFLNYNLTNLNKMNEIELWKAVIFIMWLRQAQPPGFAKYVRRPMVCAQPTGWNNFLFPAPKGRKIIMKFWK